MNYSKEVLSQLKKLNVYDISPGFVSNMPKLLGNPDFWIIPNCRTYERHHYYCQSLMIGEHTGSHIDASVHTVPGGKTIDMYSPDYFIAPYKKYDLDIYNPQPGQCISMDQIKECEKKGDFSPEPGDIVLLNYGYDKYYYQELEGEIEDGWYGKNTPGLSEEVEQYFVAKGILAIGADTVNCEIPQIDGRPLSVIGHEKYFLPNNIPIMEGFVNLGKAPIEGIFMALPLPIKGGSGSPVRAILWA